MLERLQRFAMSLVSEVNGIHRYEKTIADDMLDRHGRWRSLSDPLTVVKGTVSFTGE